jgi:hypothetical protein
MGERGRREAADPDRAQPQQRADYIFVSSTASTT